MHHIETHNEATHKHNQRHVKKQTKKQDARTYPDDWIPAEKVLPELADPVLRPAALLRGSRYRDNITQKQLAKKLNISIRRLSEMENAKRLIDKEMAKKISEVLDVDYRLFYKRK